MTSKHIRFDWAIKKLLRNKADYEILNGFLSEVLRQDVTIKDILEGEGNQDDQNDKYNRVDILVRDSADDLILVEVQNERQDGYFHRMCYGTSKAISQYIYSGDDYAKIKKVYSINIVYFDLGEGTDYIYIGENRFIGLHTHDELGLSSKQQSLYQKQTPQDIFPTYYILKPKTFNGELNDSLDEWIYFLKNSEIKDSFHAKGLDKAKEVLRIDNMTSEEKSLYNAYLKDESLYKGEISTAREEGRDEVRLQLIPVLAEERRLKEEERRLKEEERRQKEEVKNDLKKIILKFQAKGFSLEEIAIDLEKSVAEIKEILE